MKNDPDGTKNLKKLEESLQTSGSTYGTISDSQNKNGGNAKKSESSKEKKSKFTSKQKLSLLVLAIGDLCAGFLASLQTPFFPEEAEKKGATASEYGVIIGIYNLTIVFAAPIIGKLVGHISPKFILNAGYFVLGTTSILFGILDFVKDKLEFICLAFIIRISEGVGAACVRIASGTIVASQFHEDVGACYALLEMCIGVAIIIGPVIGGALYELGGFKLPFISIGCVTLVDAVFVMLVLPQAERREKKSTKFTDVFKAWVKPQILLFSFSIFLSFAFFGLTQVGLEPHIRQIYTSKLYIGLIFAVLGLVYAISSPFWGWLHDKLCRSTVINLVGCFFFMAGIILIGPMPFIPLPLNVYILCIATITIGFGAGAKTVSSFTGALYSAKQYGFPDDLGTYGIIASIITSSKSLGSAFGPTFGGVLIEKFGFRVATIPYLFTELTLIAILIGFIMAEKGASKVFRTTESKEKKKDSIISLDLKPIPSIKLKSSETAVTIRHEQIK